MHSLFQRDIFLFFGIRIIEIQDQKIHFELLFFIFPVEKGYSKERALVFSIRANGVLIVSFIVSFLFLCDGKFEPWLGLPGNYLIVKITLTSVVEKEYTLILVF